MRRHEFAIPGGDVALLPRVIVPVQRPDLCQHYVGDQDGEVDLEVGEVDEDGIDDGGDDPDSEE